jgi:transposase-like protein
MMRLTAATDRAPSCSMNRTIASLICGSVLASEGDIEELLFEPGVIVSYESIRRWCDKFGAGFARRVKAVRRKPGTTWHLDDVFVTLARQALPKRDFNPNGNCNCFALLPRC